MKTAKKSIEDTLKSLSRYYTGQVNSLDNASEMFKGLISVYGLIVPADDILICKSLVVPAVFIQGKGKVNLIELHECERGLISKVVYNVEMVHMFLKQYKTKEETKMKKPKEYKAGIMMMEINKVCERYKGKRFSQDVFNDIICDISAYLPERYQNGLVWSVKVETIPVWSVALISVNDVEWPIVKISEDPAGNIKYANADIKALQGIVKKVKDKVTMTELPDFDLLSPIDENEGEVDTDYVPFLEIVGKMAEGDIIESASGKAIMKELDKYFWCNAATGETSNTVELRGDVIQLKFRFYIPYVGWQEAFEAYENGYTIMCKYGKDMLQFNRDIVALDESNFLADVQLIGLLTTKWIIK